MERPADDGRRSPDKPKKHHDMTPAAAVRSPLIGLALLAPNFAIGSEPNQADQAAMAEEIRVVFNNVCAACHGPHGEGRQEFKAPSIAGLPSWYVVIQLDKFRTGARGSHAADLEGFQMQAMAKILKPEWIEGMAKHIESLKAHVTVSTVGGNPEFGRVRYEQDCMPCHRYNGQGEKVFRSAPLTTLSDWYLAAALEKYRTGVRGEDIAIDPDAWKMHKQVEHMPQDSILDMAAYIAELAETYPPGVRKGRVRRSLILPAAPPAEEPEFNPFEEAQSKEREGE